MVPPHTRVSVPARKASELTVRRLAGAPAGRALEPTERPWEPAEKAWEPAGRALGPAGRSFEASWEGPEAS